MIIIINRGQPLSNKIVFGLVDLNFDDVSNGIHTVY